METVVLRSDIARLVLGYLNNEQLDNASRIFCKTSPHLLQEFTAYKRGLQAYSFLPNLEEIICEYVKISRKVEELLPSLNDSLRTVVQQGKLSDKVNKLLEPSLRTWLGQCTSGEVRTNDGSAQPSPASSVHIVKNKTKMRKDCCLKRKCRSTSSSSEDQINQSISANRTKRRRIFEPFCFLNAELRDAQHATKRTNTPLHRDSESKVESSEDGNADKITSDENNEQNKNSLEDKPVNESTPYSKSESSHYQTPTVPELSQAILDNSKFQMKLVQNINEALHTTSNVCQNDGRNDIGRSDIIQTRSVSAETSFAAIVSEKTSEICSTELLDEMVKKIMEATEKDPSFDALIEEVVGEPASSKCFVSAGIQCNIGETTNEPVLEQQSIDYRVESGIKGPQTPLIIRNAMAAATALTSDSHPMQTTVANTSFGSLTDPNFSISKLIVLNSNESTQKQPPADQSATGNTNAEQLITQVNSAIETSSSTIEDQVYYDVATGQLTFPLIFTNDGLLANMPFIINNEVVAQQLQLDNMGNLETPRIENLLTEPIIVSADQLPPKSIFLSSGQNAVSEVQTLQQKQGTQTSSKPVKDSSVYSGLPSSIDFSRIQMERATPSACSIVNTKAFQSLSTPRKRASHVRTLTFSPKSSAVPTQKTGTTPLSSRRETLRRMQGDSKRSGHVERTHVSKGPSSETAIIKTVEVLPSLSAQVDPIASESSNSCNVPPLFAGEESSNQTIIRGKTPSTSEATTGTTKVSTITAPQDASVISVPITSEPSMNFRNCDVNTPMRKQQRRMAIRACKRQISREEKKQDLVQVSEEIESVITYENQENNVGAECEVKDMTIERNDQQMEEWLQMRNSSTNDLDSRLREINAKKGDSKIPAKEPKKGVRRKKVIAPTVAPAKRRKKPANISQREKEKSKLLDVSPSNQNVEKCNFQDQSKKKKTSPEHGKIAYLASKKLKEKKRASKEKPKEFNVKITTPQKSKGKRENLKNRSEKKGISKRINEAEELNCTNSSKFDQIPTATAIQSLQHVHSKNDLEIEKRTANIACLLDTPFKETNVSGIVPPTPGIFAPSLEAPSSKLKPMDEVIHSASYLFGSLTESEMDTQMLVQMPTAQTIQSLQHVHSKNDLEIDKRTGNIVSLLNTPPKEANVPGIVPRTPRVLAPTLETPSSKLKPMDEVINSASYLFGSLTENEMDTQMLVQMPTAQAIQSLQHVHSKNDLEIEKRTGNIVCLLNTPPKEANVPGIVPRTPRILAPSLETPSSKLKPMDEVINSASYLFGSLTESEMDTPMLTAITPNCRFASLIGKETTPRSVTGTEYSSGGSYYRPDESEDLDHNIDRLLRDSAQKKCVEKEVPVVESADSEQHKYKTQHDSNYEKGIEGEDKQKQKFQIVDCKVNAVSVETRAEKLLVQPIVLKRVKSTDSDAVDNAGHDSVQIDPHYTLASGLPHLSADQESSSASTSSSSTSSSSSSSSKSKTKNSSTSQSSSNSMSTFNSVKSRTVIVVSPLAFESFCEISSSEDEEWSRHTISTGVNLQLVSNDGEVRYPVSNLLTPTKKKSTHQATTIKENHPLKSSAEKGVQQVEAGDLELAGIKEKNMEITEKVHDDTGVKVGVNATYALNLACKKNKIPLSSVSVTKSKVLDDEKRPIDVLTALNLSAKKRPQRNEPQQRIPGDIDDNAVSNLFVDCSTQERKELCVPHKAEKVLRQPLQPKIGQSRQRKCLQIDALPIAKVLQPSKKTKRSTANQKKIVHKPLGFKAATEATAEGGGDVKRTMPGANSRISNVSPIPKIKKTRSPRVAGQRVSPRSSKGNVSTSEATKEQKVVGSRVLKTPLRATATKAKLIQQLEASQRTKPARNAVGTSKAKDVQLATKNQTHEGKTKLPKDQIANCKSNTKKKFKKVVCQTTTKSQNVNIDSSTGKNDMKIPDALVFTTATNPISTSNEENHLDGYELTSISENNQKFFQKFVYSGPEDWTPLSMRQSDFSNFKIVVAIDENETYTWQMSDDLILFENAPVPKASSHTSEVTHNIRNIPKKRKVRIINVNNSEESTTVLPPTEVPPVLITTLTPPDTNSQAVLISNSHTIISPAGEKLPLNAAEKIQIEDIESILSHLHGT